MLTGCAQDLIFSDINRDTVEVLRAQRLRSRHAARAALLRLAPRPQRRTGTGPANWRASKLEQFPPDQFDAIITNAGGCGSHLKHYHKLLADDPAYRDRAALWDKKVQGHPRMADRDRRASRRLATAPPQARDLPRVLPPGARAEDHRPAAPAAAADPEPEAGRAAGEHLVLRQRRHLQHHAAGDGQPAPRPQARAHPSHRRDRGRQRQHGLRGPVGSGPANVRLEAELCIRSRCWREPTARRERRECFVWEERPWPWRLPASSSSVAKDRARPCASLRRMIQEDELSKPRAICGVRMAGFAGPRGSVEDRHTPIPYEIEHLPQIVSEEIRRRRAGPPRHQKHGGIRAGREGRRARGAIHSDAQLRGDAADGLDRRREDQPADLRRQPDQRLRAQPRPDLRLQAAEALFHRGEDHGDLGALRAARHQHHDLQPVATGGRCRAATGATARRAGGSSASPRSTPRRRRPAAAASTRRWTRARWARCSWAITGDEWTREGAVDKIGEFVELVKAPGIDRRRGRPRTAHARDGREGRASTPTST